MKIKISPGNMKLGSIPNISLTPIESCPTEVPCRDFCYCNKAMRRFASTRAAWATNLAFYRSDPSEYFMQVHAFLEKNKPKLFRWHVAGDIPDYPYYALMNLMAELNAETKFLVYTKNFKIATLGRRLSNLSIILSMWPGTQSHPELEGFRRAWVQDGTEDRIPAGAIECPGKCDICAQCWEIDGLDIIFHKH